MLQTVGIRTTHAMANVLTARIPFSKDFLFRQVIREELDALAQRDVERFATVTLLSSNERLLVLAPKYLKRETQILYNE